MTELNIIGCTCGNYKTLQALLRKMPDALPLAAGNMLNKGRESKQVLDFFMRSGKAVMGCYEHQLIDFFTGTSFYDPALWCLYNGGDALLYSYFPDEFLAFWHRYHTQERRTPADYIDGFRTIVKGFPVETMEWLRSLPLYHREENILISHGALHPDLALEECCDLKVGFFNLPELTARDLEEHTDPNDNILWNRTPPKRRAEYFQIFSQAGEQGVRPLEDSGGMFGMSLDAADRLVGLHLPSFKVYEQAWL